ncbi:MAG: polysaccharide deacetylase family protein [Bacteroidota bacterium]
MKKIIILCIFVIPGLLSFAQKKQVCFSFDDLPFVSYGITDTTFRKAVVNKLVMSLKHNNIPAIGFVNENKLYNNDKINTFQVELLKCWIENGLELGNHTYSHPDYNLVSLKKYSLDIIRGESVTKELLAGKGKVLEYFRHPFLHVGNTRGKADSLESFLLQRGYKVAPVTIDNEDYLFASAYNKARIKNDTSLMRSIGRDYIDYMEKKVKYFEKQANILFGRDISQILLVHSSLLNSDYADSLAAMFRRNNYEFISMDKALEDEVYKTPVSVYGKWGISWLDRWALSMGKKGDFFRDDPVTPEYITKLSE